MAKYHISNPGVIIGADPEVFISKDGKGAKRIIVGSETVLKRPLKLPGVGSVVTDGVQVELHPRASNCREAISWNIEDCLQELHDKLAKHPGLKIDYTQVVTVSKAALEPLSDHAKFLGCKPSFNFYGREQKIVNGMEYRKRSGSGHIHLGSKYIATEKYPDRSVKPERLAPSCDILVGVIGVLQDRDPGAVERRKLYGKAGEYRLPRYGFEYRTLSNFWLISYPVTSLMLAQARNAFNVAYSEAEEGSEFLKELIARADLKKVEKAINKNDFDLAYSIYEKAIKPMLLDTNIKYGLGPDSKEVGKDMFVAFEKFISKPLKERFPHDPLVNWGNIGRGWEKYAKSLAHPLMR